ncbi:MAG TPA: hypothetical protein VGM80_00925 [Gaiellaceae bacterium]|jgi:hypothetical protein
MGLFDRKKAMMVDLHGLTEALEHGLHGSGGAPRPGMLGRVDTDLIRNGLLGRGLVTSITETGTIIGTRMAPRPVCDFGVQVTLDGEPPFAAQVRQSIPASYVPDFVPGETVVAVRVDPADRTRVGIDLSQDAPTVTAAAAAAGAPSAASVLESGIPVRAVVVGSQPLGTKTPAGVDLYALVLTVLQEGSPPRQVQLGNPVPADCVPLLYNGSNLPAKAAPDRPELVAVDWVAALAEASR